MINLLSYVGLSLQSEVCLWTLVGLLRTIFDATLFKVNANLKQVWQMNIAEELSMPVQRVLRTMISGVMLVNCFTLYVYLAAYIVLLYPVFLEERPALVIPWLIVASIRKQLCELTSLALGLGTCVLVGPARPSCIKFVVFKVSSIMPAFYMWMLVFSYYESLKITSAFKTFPATSIPSDNDFVELAVRRRRTKSLKNENELRHFLKNNIRPYTPESDQENSKLTEEKLVTNTKMVHATNTGNEDLIKTQDSLTNHPVIVTSSRTICEYDDDWFGIDINVPRDTDRVMEQFSSMLLRISVFLKMDFLDAEKLLGSNSGLQFTEIRTCNAMPPEGTDTPPLVKGVSGRQASYLSNYPQIFMKKPPEGSSLHIADKLFEVENIYTESNSKQFQSDGSLTTDLKSTLKNKRKSINDKLLSNRQTDENSSSSSSNSTQSMVRLLEERINALKKKDNQDKNSK